MYIRHEHGIGTQHFVVGKPIASPAGEPLAITRDEYANLIVEIARLRKDLYDCQGALSYSQGLVDYLKAENEELKHTPYWVAANMVAGAWSWVKTTAGRMVDKCKSLLGR